MLPTKPSKGQTTEILTTVMYNERFSVWMFIK